PAGGLGAGERLCHLPAVAAPLRPRGVAEHRAHPGPAGAAWDARHLESARAHGICVVGLARGGRALLLALQRRGHPLAAPVRRCRCRPQPPMTAMPTSPIDLSAAEHPGILRVATYNIHKGVQGMGPARRLEIHNLGLAVEQLDADIVCLQEVRSVNRREALYFDRWPEVSQAEYLAPEGYEAVYRTNAYTRHGEHGNALLTRWPVVGHKHLDIS